MKKSGADEAGQPAIVLNANQARLLQLAAQGLLRKPPRKPGPGELLAAIDRMQLLQIDTIHVVARSPYLVLHARLGAYDPTWLDEALRAGRLVECWAHEACFAPAHAYPRHRAWREQRSKHWAQRSAARLRREHAAEMDALLVHVRAVGEVRSADFERVDAGEGGWWSWKPEKRWLEAWFALGELMVLRRERFQRVYAPTENVLARLDPALATQSIELDPIQLRQRFILDSIRALGITQARWIADYYRLDRAVQAAELIPGLQNGELLAVQVRGWPAFGYVHRDHVEVLARAADGQLRATHTALLSPFDPLVWDRARLRAMFDFDYTLECYMPAPKRRYGYFVLPILHRGRLIGRLDAKAHRNSGIFEIKALFLEPGTVISSPLTTDVAATIAATAQWHSTPILRLGPCRPVGFGMALRRAWRAAEVAVTR